MNIKSYLIPNSRSLRVIFALSASLYLSFYPLAIVKAGEAADTEPDYTMTVRDALEKNTIAFYDKDDELCMPPLVGISDTGSTSGRQIVADSNAEYILKFFTDKGLSLEAAAGFVGNFIQESGLDPAKEQGGRVVGSDYQMRSGTGFGLVQWTFPERQRPLQELADRTGRSIIDLDLQLDYVWQELNSGWKSTLHVLNTTPNLTPEMAAVIVHGKTDKITSAIQAGADPNVAIYRLAPSPAYEGSYDSASGVYSVRGGNARQVFDKFSGQIEGGGGVSNVGSETDQPYNCMPIVSTESSTGATLSSSACTATSPVYGRSGGNGRQLKKQQFEMIYGTVAEAMNKQVRVDFNGHSVQVHELVAPCLIAVVEDIKASGSTYKVVEIGGWRSAGTGAGKVGAGDGYHDYGVAVDINRATNDYYPSPGNYPYDMPSEYIRAFNGRGWSWGGDYITMKDYMHFEFNGVDLPENAF